MSSRRIKFYSKYFSILEKPITAKKKIPSWYKNIESYPRGKIEGGSVKKCVPFLDALTSGYYIVNNFEIYISWKIPGKELNFRYNQNIDQSIPNNIGSGIKDHLPWQIPSDFYNEEEIKHPLKFDSPWVVRTPKNYSCMFLNPPNTPSPIRLIEGIVDTDEYNLNINFPFVLKNFEKEVIIPLGQPISWVVPFKRESWKMEIYDYDGFNEEDNVNYFKYYLDNYKKLTWSKKNYD